MRESLWLAAALLLAAVTSFVFVDSSGEISATGQVVFASVDSLRVNSVGVDATRSAVTQGLFPASSQLIYLKARITNVAQNPSAPTRMYYTFLRARIPSTFWASMAVQVPSIEAGQTATVFFAVDPAMPASEWNYEVKIKLSDGAYNGQDGEWFYFSDTPEDANPTPLVTPSLSPTPVPGMPVACTLTPDRQSMQAGSTNVITARCFSDLAKTNEVSCPTLFSLSVVGGSGFGSIQPETAAGWRPTSTLTVASTVTGSIGVTGMYAPMPGLPAVFYCRIAIPVTPSTGVSPTPASSTPTPTITPTTSPTPDPIPRSCSVNPAGLEVRKGESLPVTVKCFNGAGNDFEPSGVEVNCPALELYTPRNEAQAGTFSPNTLSGWRPSTSFTPFADAREGWTSLIAGFNVNRVERTCFKSIQVARSVQTPSPTPFVQATKATSCYWDSDIDNDFRPGQARRVGVVCYEDIKIPYNNRDGSVVYQNMIEPTNCPTVSWSVPSGNGKVDASTATYYGKNRNYPPTGLQERAGASIVFTAGTNTPWVADVEASYVDANRETKTCTFPAWVRRSTTEQVRFPSPTPRPPHPARTCQVVPDNVAWPINQDKQFHVNCFDDKKEIVDCPEVRWLSAYADVGVFKSGRLEEGFNGRATRTSGRIGESTVTFKPLKLGEYPGAIETQFTSDKFHHCNVNLKVIPPIPTPRPTPVLGSEAVSCSVTPGNTKMLKGTTKNFQVKCFNGVSQETMCPMLSFDLRNKDLGSVVDKSTSESKAFSFTANPLKAVQTDLVIKETGSQRFTCSASVEVSELNELPCEGVSEESKPVPPGTYPYPVSFKTSHPYANNVACKSYLYTCPEGKLLKAYLKVNTEEGKDYVYVFDENGKAIKEFTGRGPNEGKFGWVNMQANKVRFGFYSDESGSDFGLEVTQINCVQSTGGCGPTDFSERCMNTCDSAEDCSAGRECRPSVYGGGKRCTPIGKCWAEVNGQIAIYKYGELVSCSGNRYEVIKCQEDPSKQVESCRAKGEYCGMPMEGGRMACLPLIASGQECINDPFNQQCVSGGCPRDSEVCPAETTTPIKKADWIQDADGQGKLLFDKTLSANSNLQLDVNNRALGVELYLPKYVSSVSVSLKEKPDDGRLKSLKLYYSMSLTQENYVKSDANAVLFSDGKARFFFTNPILARFIKIRSEYVGTDSKISTQNWRNAIAVIPRESRASCPEVTGNEDLFKLFKAGVPEKTVAGRLEARIIENIDEPQYSKTEYYVASGKENTRVFFKTGEVIPRPGTMIEVNGQSSGSTLKAKTFSTGLQFKALNAPVLKAPVVGRLKVLVIVARIDGKDANVAKIPEGAAWPSQLDKELEPATRENVERLFFGNHFGSVKDFYFKNSFGKLNIEGTVIGPIDLYDVSERNDLPNQAIAAVDPEVNFNEYDAIVIIAPKPRCEEKIGGWSNIGPTSISTNEGQLTKLLSVDYIGKLRHTVHELGHGLGLHHASMLTCTGNSKNVPLSDSCTFEEYGDVFSIMGAPYVIGEINAPHKEDLGWLSGTITSSGTYTLMPQEQSVSEGQIQEIKIPLRVKPSQYPIKRNVQAYYAIERRNIVDYDFWAGGLSTPYYRDWIAAYRGVIIRITSDYNENAVEQNYLLSTGKQSIALISGQSFADEKNDVCIKVKASTTKNAFDVEVSDYSTCPEDASQAVLSGTVSKADSTLTPTKAFTDQACILLGVGC